jgi:hypothetical protein
MIANPQALEDLRASWTGVQLLRSKIQRALLGSFAMGSPFVLSIVDAAHNLPFLQACAVLNDVLARLRDEGYFRSGRVGDGRTPLGTLVSDSERALSWVNYPLIDKIVVHRNDLAHRAVFVSRGDCWRYIDAIEAELVSWGIVLPVEDKAP